MDNKMKYELKSLFEHMISVSDLGRGKASKVVQEIRENNEQYIVVKNNKPQAVMLSVDEYSELIEAKEELQLLSIAIERSKNFKEEDMLSWEQVIKNDGLSETEINKLINKVDIE